MSTFARFACIVALSLPVLAAAQAAGTAVPAATCTKPVVPAIGTKLNKAASEKLNAESTAYAACANAHIKALRATAAEHQATANRYTDASNAYVGEFNAFGTALTAFSKAQAAQAPATE